VEWTATLYDVVTAYASQRQRRALKEGGNDLPARDNFGALLTIWKRPPWGDEDEAAAWVAYVEICREDPDIADEIVASARRWVAAYQHKPDMLKPLEKWLSKGTWKNLPPQRKQPRNAGKVSLSDIALAITRDDGSDQS